MTITNTNKDKVSNLIKEGKGKDYIEGYLLMEGYSKADILAYLKELGLVGKLTFRAKLHNKLSAEYVTVEWFTKEIEGESTNVLNHIKVYDNERILGNRIHCIYNQEARDLLELELKGEIKPAAKKAAPIKKPVAKKRVSK